MVRKNIQTSVEGEKERHHGECYFFGGVGGVH